MDAYYGNRNALDGDRALTYYSGEHLITTAMNEELSLRQQDVLDFIEKYQFEFGASPTLREMREHLGVASDNAVLKHLSALVKKGYIEKDDTPRGIKLLNSVKQRLQSATFNIPVLGFIPAGGPIAASEHVEDYIAIDMKDLKLPQSCFCLKVKGESMLNAGILDGDLVLADSSKTPKNGDIVVALVDGGNTVKTYINKGGKTFLKAENPEFDDIYPEEQLVIQGVVVKLLRNY